MHFNQRFDYYNLFHNPKITSINYLGTFKEYLASNFNSSDSRSNKFGVKNGSVPVRFDFINDEIKNITIDDEVINTGASLAYCTLPENIKKIEVSSLSNNFFWNTKNLKNVVLSSIQTIPTNAFANSDLENIEIPSGCNTIKSQAFNGCSNLNEIKLPSTI